VAVLSGKTTSGKLAWDKYVVDNPKWKDIHFVIEHKMEAVMTDVTGKKALFTLPEKTEFKVINQTLKTIGKVKFAQVSYKNKNGLIPISKIRKPTNTDVLKEEAIALDKLDQQIKKIVSKIGPFELVIKGDPKRKVYTNITGARNVTEKVLGREAKSDFNIVSTSGDEIYISHKKEGGASAFQQYGGVSKKAGIKIEQHEEVQNFLKKLINYIEDQRLKNPVYSYVEDDKLINMAVFGHNYGDSNFGIDNVTIIGQGEAIIKPVNRHETRFELDFSDHLVHNGDSKEFKEGSYRAVLGATYRAGRGFEVDGNSYSGARVGIYPAKLMINRSDVAKI